MHSYLNILQDCFSAKSTNNLSKKVQNVQKSAKKLRRVDGLGIKGLFSCQKKLRVFPVLLPETSKN